MVKGASARQAEQGTGAFATTHWSVVLSAQRETSPLADNALETLCKAYWYPLYAYVRRRGHDATAAKDLTQEFFAQLLLNNSWPGLIRRRRFRSWLLGVMNHFLAHEWAKATAQKRGGAHPLFSLDELEAEERYSLEPLEDSTPERVFDRRWAFTVLEHAAARLRQEYELAGKRRLYDRLKDFVSTDATNLRYEEAAQQLELTTSATKSAIHRLRQRYQELIRTEIAETVNSAAEIDEEIRYLLAVIRG
jgi:RNA polymerase sigma-70 factor (ECF subfamily)